MTIDDFLKSRGWHVERVDNTPKHVTVECTTSETVRLLDSENHEIVAITVTHNWKRGNGRDDSGRRFADAIDEFEDRQIHPHRSHTEVRGTIPPEIWAAANRVRNGLDAVTASVLIMRDRWSEGLSL